MVKQGHIVNAFVTDYSDKQRAIVRAIGAEPIDYAFSRTGLNPFRDIKDTFALAKKIKAIKPDLVF